MHIGVSPVALAVSLTPFIYLFIHLPFLSSFLPSLFLQFLSLFLFFCFSPHFIYPFSRTYVNILMEAFRKCSIPRITWKNDLSELALSVLADTKISAAYMLSPSTTYKYNPVYNVN
jgi:hypothetical protein